MQTEIAHALRQTVESYKGVHPTQDTRGEGWQVWYSQWLLMFSDITTLLGVALSARELEQLLLRCDNLYKQEGEEEAWHDFVAKKLIEAVKPA